MKKHIKKKLLLQTTLPDDVMEVVNQNEQSSLPNGINPTKKFPKDWNAFAITDKNEFFKMFQFEYQGAIRFIPEPDPVLVYFDAAYKNFKQISDKKTEILKVLVQPKMGEPMVNELYAFFSLTSGFVIFLFTAMEAFINRRIPHDFVFKKETNKSTELFTKRQIEEFFSFKDKMTIILPEVTKKNFEKSYRLKYDHICSLKEYRDAIVHTKTASDGNITYDHLYKKAFKFNFEDTINAVADFCNFYHEVGNYIVECDCNGSW